MYHVYSRGAARQVIFPGDADRLFFLEKIAALVEETGFEVFLLCLMDNHFHLGLRTSEDSLSRFMQRLQTSYAVYFNHRYERSGHVIQGRFQARQILGSRDLLQLSRYIHLNPVNTSSMASLSLEKKLAALRSYPWSSYRGYLGLSTRHPFIEYERILNFFNNRSLEPGKRYQRFVENGLRYSRSYLNKCIVDPGFFLTQQSEDALIDRPNSATSPLDSDWILERCAAHFQLSPVYLTEPQYYVLERAMAAKLMIELGGLTQQDAALKLGWKSNAALSIQLRNFRKKCQAFPDLQERLDRLRSDLKQARS
jgi:REP element-mobilizing transposase RayT